MVHEPYPEAWWALGDPNDLPPTIPHEECDL